MLADEARLEIALGAAQHQFEDVQRLPAKPGESADGAGAALSPMNGRVVSVAATSGQTVRKGETLAVVEAMKMEHQIRSPRDGVVTAVRVKAGDQVATRAVLVEVGDG